MKKIDNNIFEFFNKKEGVVFVHAHPDDEVFLTAGIMQGLVSKGIDCLIIYTSAGLSDNNLDITKIRQQEAFEACGILGVTRIEFLPYCDKRMKKNSIIDFSNEEVAKDIVSVIKKHFNDKYTLVSYDSNGGYGDIEHKKLHQICLKVFDLDRLNITNLYEVTINRNKINSLVENNSTESKYLPNLVYWDKYFGLDDGDIDLFYVLNNDELENKRRSFNAHKTQIKQGEFPISLAKKDFETFFGIEYFRVDSDN